MFTVSIWFLFNEYPPQALLISVPNTIIIHTEIPTAQFKSRRPFTVFQSILQLLVPLPSPLDPADSRGHRSMSLFLYGEELAGYPPGCFGSPPKRTWKGNASQRWSDGVCSPDRVGKRQVAGVEIGVPERDMG
jgi:hypothetical protein